MNTHFFICIFVINFHTLAGVSLVRFVSVNRVGDPCVFGHLHFCRIELYAYCSILCKEAIEGLYHLTEFRQIRLQKVTEGLPAAVWYVIFFGAMLNIVITWFFVTDRFRVHILMTSMYAALLGSLIFLVAAMDNPFRGEFSVGSDALEAVLAKMK